jgi:actin-related protein
MLSSASRLAWGGAQAQELLQRLVQLKYPSFPNKIQPFQATVSRLQISPTRNVLTLTLRHRCRPQFMARESLYFADDFSEEVRALADPTTLDEKSVIMQFPFTAPVRTQVSDLASDLPLMVSLFEPSRSWKRSRLKRSPGQQRNVRSLAGGSRRCSRRLASRRYVAASLKLYICL